MISPAVVVATAFVSLLAGMLQARRALRRFRPALELWWLITAAIVVVMLFFALFAGPQFGFIGYPMSVIVTPLLTVVLTIHSPIPWGSAASAVTVLHGAAWLGSMIARVGYVQGDLDLLARVYVVNAVFVAGVAVVRLRKPRGG
jgi:hypothetical protein